MMPFGTLWKNLILGFLILGHLPTFFWCFVIWFIVNFKLDILAILNWKMLILTPLYLGNRGIKWVWKWSQIWVSTTGSMIFIVCKFLIFRQKVSEFWKGQKGNFYEKIHALHQFYVIIGVQNGYKSGVRLLFRHLEVWLSGTPNMAILAKIAIFCYLKVILPDVEIINQHHFCTHFVTLLLH